MDDGWEMSDGVQAKVPIRGQPEGGVCPTGANGRRLGETAAVATAQPRLLNPDQAQRCVSALLCIFFPQIYGSHFSILFEIGIALHAVCVCACMLCVIAWGCSKCPCASICMAISVGGKQRVRVCKRACAWVVEKSGGGGGGAGVPKWWLVRKDDG